MRNMRKMTKLEKLVTLFLATKMARDVSYRMSWYIEKDILALPNCSSIADVISVSASRASAAGDLQRAEASVKELVARQSQLEEAVGAEIAAHVGKANGTVSTMIFDGSVSVSCHFSKPMRGKNGKMSRRVVHGTVEVHVYDKRAFTSFVSRNVLPLFEGGSYAALVVLLEEIK